MKTSSVVGAVLALSLAFSQNDASADDKKPPAPAAAAPAPAATAAPAAAPEMPKPSAELDAFMKDLLGTWKCDTTMLAGAMGPGSPEVKTHAKVKFSKAEQFLNGFFYRGEFSLPKSKEMPTPMSGLFYMGYEPASKQVVSMAVDSMGCFGNGLGPLTATSATWTGEMYMMGKKTKYRESITKISAKEVSHKMEIDTGKGFQTMGEDICKK